MGIDLSVVIVNYNTRDLVLDCLRSVYEAASGIVVECIIVDNASAEGIADALKAHFPAARLIANTDNRYFSAANNQGIASAQGRYVVALNPDMVVKGQTLTQLVTQLDGDSAIGAATTVMLLLASTLTTMP